MSATRVRELLQLARQLMTQGHPEDILATAHREIVKLTGVGELVVGFMAPNEGWEHGLHVQLDAAGVRRLGPAERSALFAVHRRLAKLREPLAIARSDETAAIFRGLGCTGDVISAVPLVHRTGRVWGLLVLRASFGPHAETLDEIAQLVTVALENAQRLAFARRDQDRLLLLSEAMYDALYDWNFDTREFWWGGGILKLLSSSSDPVDASARWKLEQIHPDDRERVRASLEQARFSTSQSWVAEYRFHRPDGSYIHVEDHGYFLRETNGRAFRMIGSMRDVTGVKSALEREQQARAEAESASRAKDEFLAMLGHELRNPLAPIVTGLQLVRLRGGIDVDKELTVLERQAQHLIRLVDDLLDISRIAHGKISLRKERLEVGTVIADAIETASPLIESRMHALTIDVPAHGLPVDADRARLAQAVANLLNNAAKYTEPNGHIAVRAWRDGDRVAISVRDSGIGIDREMLPKVFSIFVQEKQAIDRAHGGLGLGLSIVRNLVELHDGSVEARSEGRGRGSELVVRLPVARTRERHDSGEMRRIDPRVIGKRILVVDDNVDAAELLALMLERLGNTTRVAHDPHQALEVAGEFSPELAVLDIGLPVMDGYELARRMRELPAAKATRLIALTGYGQASDRERAERAGFDAHLVKPIGLDAIQAAIARLAS